MKKFSALLIAVIMVISLAACNGKTDDNGETGNVGMGNPWVEVKAEDMQEKIGFTFGVPSGAENVIYLWCESIGYAEMQFDLDGTHWNARTAKTAAFEDISGMYYDWTPGCYGKGDEIDLYGITGTQRMVKTEDGVAESALWYQENTGFMFSLSCVADDIVDFPAEDVFIIDSGNGGK